MAELPDDFQDETKIYPILAELSACLCNQLGSESPCFCGIIVGNDVPVEYAGLCDDEDCGAAYVRLVNAFPSVNFPEPDGEARCNSIMAYTVAVGIVRCTSVGQDNGEPPEPEEVATLSRRLLADMAKIRRTIQCCFTSGFEDVDYIMGAYTPLPMQGGVTGGEMLLTVREAF